MRHATFLARATALALLVVGTAACPTERSEALDPSTLPDDVRADYAVFAHTCSKCHSLQRPLASGITDDMEWKRYVAKMRLQPGSGITIADEEPVLRFLHYYSRREIEAKTQAMSPDGGPQ